MEGNGGAAASRAIRNREEESRGFDEEADPGSSAAESMELYCRNGWKLPRLECFLLRGNSTITSAVSWGFLSAYRGWSLEAIRDGRQKHDNSFIIRTDIGAANLGLFLLGATHNNTGFLVHFQWWLPLSSVIANGYIRALPTAEPMNDHFPPSLHALYDA